MTRRRPVTRSIGRLVGRVVGSVRGAVTPRRRPGATAGAIVVTYEPAMDGDPDPGEVVWGWVPFEDDPRQGKDRPLVVVGRRDGSLVGVPLTSKRDDRDPQVAVGTGSWDRDRRESYARVDRVVTVDPRSVRREGAALHRDRFDELVRELGRRYRVERG